MILRNDEAKKIDLGGGVERKVLAHEEELMCVEVSFTAGAVGASHTHPHVQATYVESGKFEVTVGDETKVLEKGDSFSVPKNVPHGVVCLENGKLIDFFTPMRKDFLP